MSVCLFFSFVYVCVRVCSLKRNIFVCKEKNAQANRFLQLNVYLVFSFLFFRCSIRRMVEERVKLCDEHLFQCSICCNDIDDKTNIYQINSCHCQFCREVRKRGRILISIICGSFFSVFDSIVPIKSILRKIIS